MALFRKKNTDGNGEAVATEADETSEGFTPQPEKAAKWFQHAKTAADSANYQYALECYANGMRLDPHSMTAHEAMFEVARRHLAGGGKPISSKQKKGLDDGTDVGRFAAHEYAWMSDLKNFKAAVQCLHAAIKAEQFDFGHWMATHVYALLRAQKKMGKKDLLLVMDLLGKVGAWNEALNVGELARQMDPADSDLANRLKNLAAQRVMEEGRYDEAGEEGGYRKSIKDLDKQRELIEEESLAGGGGSEERNLDRAKAAFEENPTQSDTVNRYAQLLKKSGAPEDVEEARNVYLRAYEATNEYRFRMQAGDMDIERLAARVRELEPKAGDPAIAPRLEEAKTALRKKQLEEYEERVGKYPTDRFRKYELGRVQYDLGRYEDAMAQFQASKDEPKLSARATHMLGRCFLQEGWFGEAVAEFQEAAKAVENVDRDYALVVKYDLMLALMGQAKADRNADLAREARTICSEIARRNITYRDIKDRRKEVDELIAELEG